jgi:hypothetical protein
VVTLKVHRRPADKRAKRQRHGGQRRPQQERDGTQCKRILSDEAASHRQEARLRWPAKRSPVRLCACADEPPMAVWLEGADALRPLGWWSGRSVLAGNLSACCCKADFLHLPDPPKKRGKATSSSLRSAALYGRSSTSTRRRPSPTLRG